MDSPYNLVGSCVNCLSVYSAHTDDIHSRAFLIRDPHKVSFFQHVGQRGCFIQVSIIRNIVSPILPKISYGILPLNTHTKSSLKIVDVQCARLLWFNLVTWRKNKKKTMSSEVVIWSFSKLTLSIPLETIPLYKL